MGDLGIEQLLRLCTTLGYDAAEARVAQSVFRTLSEGWGGRPIDAPPEWKSDITDDHTPYEFSLAIDEGAPELRFLMEAQGPQPTLFSHWEAARHVNARLHATWGVHLDRLKAVEDLFAPGQAGGLFTLWHAVCFPLGKDPVFKVYLNPQARGAARASRLVQTAMARLGFGAAFAQLPALTREDTLCYFSLDLSAARAARVKIYIAHANATAAQIEAVVSGVPGHVPDQASEFCRAMSGSWGPYTARPVITCFSFVEGTATPTAATVHFPVRCYASDDGAVRDRVLSHLPREASHAYARALEAFTHRELEDASGLQTYVSRRLVRGRKRLTVYLAPEVYAARYGYQRRISGTMLRRNVFGSMARAADGSED